MSAPVPARVFTWSGLRWIVRHRAWSRWYLVRYWRFAWLRLRAPHVVTEGLVFLGRGVRIQARRDRGRLVLGAWVHIGDGSAIRCHEGTLRIGPKAVLGARTTVNCYLDVEIGAAALIADDVYVCDFDHVTADPIVPIKDQGIVKSPVRIGPEAWLGTKVVVLRGARVGRGAVLGAHSVARGVIPALSVAVGSPARVVRRRGDRPSPATPPEPGPADARH